MEGGAEVGGVVNEEWREKHISEFYKKWHILPFLSGFSPLLGVTPWEREQGEIEGGEGGETGEEVGFKAGMLPATAKVSLNPLACLI